MIWTKQSFLDFDSPRHFSSCFVEVSLKQAQTSEVVRQPALQSRVAAYSVDDCPCERGPTLGRIPIASPVRANEGCRRTTDNPIVRAALTHHDCPPEYSHCLVRPSGRKAIALPSESVTFNRAIAKCVRSLQDGVGNLCCPHVLPARE